MAKWWKIANYILNPIGSALGDVATKLGVNEKVAHNVATPFGASWFASLGRENRAYQKRANIERIANDAGMSLEEFLKLNPEFAKEYENADKGIFQRAKDVVGDKVDKFVDNVTGERDTAENEKNRQFQHDEAELNRSWEVEQAQQAREWDSIGAQMERAASVGVNPISIAMQNGGINSSGPTSIPSSPYYPSGSSSLMHNGALDIFSTVMGGIGTLAENRLKQSQSDDIVAMRQYNIAEKIANTNYLQQLGVGVGLSNVSQRIQNSWLDVMNQASYDNMLIQNGVGRETILEKRSIRLLNLQQVSSIRQDMSLNLQKFNATLPLELQLLESEINSNNMTTQEKYTEICMRHLQAIEQENRNRQSSAEADSAEVQSYIAKSTYEDAISQFHNDMVKSAADAGVSLYEYQYYGSNYDGFFDWMGKTERSMFRNRFKRIAAEKVNNSIIHFPENVGNE